MSAEIETCERTVSTEISAIRELAKALEQPNPSDSDLRGPESCAELSSERLSHLRSLRSDYEAQLDATEREMLRLCTDCRKNFEELAVFREGFSTLSDHGEYEALDKRIVEAVESDKGLTLPVNATNLHSLRNRLASLISEKQSRRSELSRLGEDIARLWTVLHVSSQERDRFQSSFTLTLSVETLNRGRQELRRLKEIRSKNMEKVVRSLREEVEALWSECGMSEEQKQTQFPLFFSPPERLDDIAVCRFSVRLNSR